MRQWNNTSGRELWIDCTKGIGIILVVLGHTYGVPAWLKHWIYSFHMPLFFILSGITMNTSNQESIKTVVKKNAKAYLLPYFHLCALNLILECACLSLLGQLSIERVCTFVKGILYCYANMEWMPNCSPLWFLPCLFIAKCVFLLIMQNTSGKSQTVCISMCCVISYLWYRLSLPRLPWNIATALMAVFFLWIGYEVRKNNIVNRLSSNPLRMLVFIPVIMISPMLIGNGELVGMNENTYGNLGLFLIGALGYSMLIFTGVKLFPANRVLADFFGRNTIIVIGFNYFCRYVSTELYYLVPVINKHQIHWIISFLLTTFLLVGMIMLWMTIKKAFEKRNKKDER